MKTLFIGDTHDVVGDIESDSLFPRYIRSLPVSEQRSAYERFRKTIEDANDFTLLALSKSAAWDVTVHLGDITCGYGERGIFHPSARRLTEKRISSYRSISKELFVCWGNHDLGYGGESRRVDPESLAACGEISPFFWSREVAGSLLIGLTSSLFEQKNQDVSEVREKSSDQADFFSDILRRNRSERWALCIHTVREKGFWKIASPYFGSLSRIIYGHDHGPFWERIEQVRSDVLGRKPRAILCPSVAPLWWRGGGYLASLSADKLSPQSGKVEFPLELRKRIAELPFSSFWGAIKAMI